MKNKTLDSVIKVLTIFVLFAILLAITNSYVKSTSKRERFNHSRSMVEKIKSLEAQTRILKYKLEKGEGYGRQAATY